MENLLHTVLIIGDTDVVGGDFAGTETVGTGGTAVPAEGAPAAEPQSGFGGNFMLIMAVMLVVWLFFMMRTNKKQQQRRQQVIDEITKGSKVATSGGMFGVVTEVKADSFVVEIAPGVPVEFAKAAIAGRREEAGDDKGKGANQLDNKDK